MGAETSECACSLDGGRKKVGYGASGGWVATAISDAELRNQVLDCVRRQEWAMRDTAQLRSARPHSLAYKMGVHVGDHR